MSYCSFVLLALLCHFVTLHFLNRPFKVCIAVLLNSATRRLKSTWQFLNQIALLWHLVLQFSILYFPLSQSTAALSSSVLSLSILCPTFTLRTEEVKEG